MRILFFIITLIFINFEIYARTITDSFADLVEDLVPAVVSIASTTIIKQQEQTIPQFPEGSPFDEFFKEYFDREQRRTPSRKPLVGLGSGFIIDKGGIVVTNNHVIEGADEISVIMYDQSEYSAEVIGRDPRADIAVLKIDSKGKELKNVQWGNSDEARVGDWTIAIGNPLGLGGTVTAGIVSAIARDIGGGSYVKFIQTDASINRGNSGGPLFNINGEIIGINTAIISQTGGSIGLGFAIPSNNAKKIVSQLIEFGKTKRGWLGVEITNVSEDMAESLGLSDTKGAFVSGVNPEGPSKDAGIQEGDVILMFNNEEVTKMLDLPRLVADSEIGSIAKVKIWRKNKIITIEVELGELPEKRYGKKKLSERASEEKKILDLGLYISATKENNGVIVKVNENESSDLINEDIIVEVNREEITTLNSFIEIINKIKKTGRSSLLLKVIRDDKTVWTTIKFLK
tara:strand:- start:3133 stop:4506 length:1374 start_codon:yes stop_codon:yes gene_type:complete